ncbi:hypothetical protein [Pseudomonas sp. EYE_354]|uniref:hypothetical protein n=1 Tax=Pseudomonas sp. EYE_354 TaxID=2853449 RepID=UPI0020035420|nr:hypothetical protein [Pseudomonas sp. EYE_354]MCK6189632.1 hypothetical protein [Pseudomonas sp. EYE_354]
MTNIDSWNPWVAIGFLSTPFLLAVTAIAYSVYLSRCQLDAIKEALKNSRYIYIWGNSLGKRGLIWSVFEISKIAGMVVWPRASIIIGEVNPADLEKFPPYLKRYLIVNMTLMITSLAWIIAQSILLEFG